MAPLSYLSGSDFLPLAEPIRLAKKSLPLSSTTMNAGKSTTSIYPR